MTTKQTLSYSHARTHRYSSFKAQKKKTPQTQAIKYLVPHVVMFVYVRSTYEYAHVQRPSSIAVFCIANNFNKIGTSELL